jgi:hypothetical protein
MNATQTADRFEKLAPAWMPPTAGSSAASGFTPDAAQPSGVSDAAFGTVRIGWSQQAKAVENAHFGVARLVRDPADGVADHVVVLGAEGAVHRERGFLRRRGSDVHVDLNGRRYTLHHTSNWRAQLLRDDVPIGWLRRRRSGRFFPDFFKAGWSRTYEVTHWATPPDPSAAAIAHLLASQYEIGATGAVINTFALVSLPFRILSV